MRPFCCKGGADLKGKKRIKKVWKWKEIYLSIPMTKKSYVHLAKVLDGEKYRRKEHKFVGGMCDCGAD